MPDSTTLVDFEGAITFGTIEMLLNQLRANGTFNNLEKPVRKRLYGIFVESIDNIFKYGIQSSRSKAVSGNLPRIEVRIEHDSLFVFTGNVVPAEVVEDLKFKLDRVNQLDMEGLKSLYEEVINKESHERDRGAGLGLITMAMRTCDDIEYSFTPLDEHYCFFTMKIYLNLIGSSWKA